MGSKQAVVQIIYPLESASSFNKEYYLEKHMPFVVKQWGQHGLISWIATEGNKDAGYHMQVSMAWESLEAYKNLNQDDVDSVMADVKNYTSVAPYEWIGEVTGQWTAAK
jgi:uncharacterized protein (TIGR02118 family)